MTGGLNHYYADLYPNMGINYTRRQTIPEEYDQSALINKDQPNASTNGNKPNNVNTNTEPETKSNINMGFMWIIGIILLLAMGSR